MVSPPLLALLASAAEEKAPPVIDIDGTVLVQFAIFLCMYFVLKHLFFRPYLELKKLRTQSIDGAREEAQAMELRAREMGAEHDRRIQAAKQQAEAERTRMRGEGGEREREVLAEARSAAHARLQATRMQIQKQVQAASKELQQQAQPLARLLAKRVLGREVQP